MSPSRRSSISSNASDSPKNHYYEFIVNKLLRYGCLPLNQLTSQMSALPHNVQNAIGISKFAVRSFLDEYPDVFNVDGKGNVSLIDRERTEHSLRSKRDSSCESRASSSVISRVLPKEIKNGRGVIYRLFSTFGFIKVVNPIKTTLYFSTLNFKKHERALIADYNLELGQMMGFDAVRGPVECEAKYKAVSLWFAEEDYSDDDDCSVSSRSDRNRARKPNRRPPQRNFSKKISDNTSCVDQSKVFPRDIPPPLAKGPRVQKPTPQHVNAGNKVAVKNNDVAVKANRPIDDDDDEQDNRDYSTEGIVQKVFDSHGFLIIKDDVQEHVFFHRNRIVDGGKLSSLTEVLQKGDLVIFEAIQSKKPSSEAKWEATKVWLNHPRLSGKNISNNIGAPKNKYSKNNGLSKNKLDKNTGSSINTNNKSSPVGPDVDPNATCLKAYRGKIFYPPSDDIVIKFGPSDCYEASIDPSSVYLNCEIVEDVKWSILEGESVKFDAYRSNKNSDWQITLVWIGNRPDVSATKIEEKSEDSPEPPNLEPDSVADSAPAYANWADCPYSEDEEEGCQNDVTLVEQEVSKPVSQDPDDTEVYISDEESENDNTDRVNTNSLSNVQENEDNFNPQSETDRETVSQAGNPIKENILSDSDNEYKDCDENDVQAATSKNETAANGSPGNLNKFPKEETEDRILFFENIEGKVTRVTRSYVELKCAELEKAIGFFRADFYENGVLMSENYTHMSEVLSVGSKVRLNCFKVIDDSGHVWHKPTIIWTGQKPRNIKEMEPSEFIEVQNLPVSCKIPTWKAYKKINKEKKSSQSKPSASKAETQKPTGESMGLLNNLPSPSRTTPPKQQARPDTKRQPQPETSQRAEASNDICASCSSNLRERIKESFMYFQKKIKKLEQQVKSKESQKSLQDLQMAIHSFNEFLVSETLQCSHDPQREEKKQRDVKKNKTTATQTVVTGKVFYSAIFQDE